MRYPVQNRYKIPFWTNFDKNRIVAGIFHKRNTLVKTTIQMIFDKSDYSGKGGGKVVSC